MTGNFGSVRLSQSTMAIRSPRAQWLLNAVVFASIAVAMLLGACTDDGGVAQQARIVKDHAPRVAAIIVDDIARHRRGLQRAADRIAAGFVRAKPERIEREMRTVMRMIRSTKKGIPELVISPMSFMAVVGLDGKVIARNAEPDKMRGIDLAKMFPQVGVALGGNLAGGMGEFTSLEEGGEPSVTYVMAAPAHYRGKVVGALVMGIPLWRWSQRLSKQLQMEAASDASTVLWVYLYRGDKLYHHATPRDLDKVVPDGKVRRAGLKRSPGGFTGRLQQYGFWYGWGVRPLPVLGDDIGAVIFRMDPD